MNISDIAEVRKQFSPDRFSPSVIRGCYVDSKHEIVSLFRLDFQALPQEERDQYAALFRKVLTGVPGQVLHSITLPPQSTESDEFKLLLTLRDGLQDNDEACEVLYHRIIDSLRMEGSYLILLTGAVYDVLTHASDTFRYPDSENVFTFTLCAVCPVKLSRAMLTYASWDNTFHESEPEWVVSAPALGFLYPAYEGGSANLYSALYFAKDKADIHEELIQAVLGAQAPACAAEQQSRFASLLEETLQEDCSLEVLQTMHEDIRERLAANKADKEADPLEFNGADVKQILTVSGVSPDKAQAFEEQYNASFPKGSALKAVNAMEAKQFQITTPEVVIKVDPEHTDLIETRTINGVQYVLIRADKNVEVNGVRIHL